jgi:hypothetical protein
MITDGHVVKHPSSTSGEVSMIPLCIARGKAPVGITSVLQMCKETMFGFGKIAVSIPELPKHSK